MPRTQSRRSFLKTNAAVTAAALVRARAEFSAKNVQIDEAVHPGSNSRSR
jgi:GAF domain-containing protein